ncbi:MAG TPA: M1 family aminopeptidase [Steroidobacteraceae bacterium]
MRFVSAVMACWLAGTAPAAPAPAGREVLPGTVTPDHYRIDVTPDVQALTFSGSVQIDISVHAATDAIVLNAADLVIDSAALSGSARAPAVRYDRQLERLTLALGQTIAPGVYTLSLAYHGRIYRQASGLFALDYDTPHGKARALFTQFEDADARRFVPCWDEPALKATFELTATVPADRMAVSNMPVVSTTPLPGARARARVRFAPTPRMSSYLLFFGLGDFERVHRVVDGVDVGVVVKRGDTASAAYALDAATRVLSYYDDYFAIPYPLPKLDLIAGPGLSVFFGAMENWGAIFYFEDELLIDPRIATQADRQRVSVVVSHEMAHQWFGDLVTMAWWDDLWLNEGFASWMQNKAVDHFHPEWNIWLQSLDAKQRAMLEDARAGTHPVITPISAVRQADSAFDSITYWKGAQVIRTLESYLGEEPFRAGVRRYLRDHAYANAVTDDLWREMDRGSTRPITRIAHDLTLQAGVPMVSETSARCAGDITTLELAQGRYAIDPESSRARLWHVPATVASLGGPRISVVLAGAAPRPVQVPGCGAVILNTGQTAYARSRYTAAGLAALAAHFKALSPEDQLGLLNDASSLAYVGEQSMAEFLDLTRSVPTDVDAEVATALIGLLEELYRLYDGLPAQTAFRGYALGVLGPILERIGWDPHPGEADNTALLRSALIQALGDLGDPAVLAQARQRFERYLADSTSLDADTRRTVLAVIAVSADPATWKTLHGLLHTARSQIERQQLYGLLASAQDRGLARQALELALSGEPPATQVSTMIETVARRHPAMTLAFAVAHWERIEPLLEPESRSGFVPKLALNASDPRLIGVLDRFAAAHIPPGAREDLRRAESAVHYRAMIRRQRLPEIGRWLHAGAG